MPSNTTAATSNPILIDPLTDAFEVTVDPGDVGGGVANSLWWDIEATEDGVYSPFAWTDESIPGNEYEPYITVWTGPASGALTLLPTPGAGIDEGFGFSGLRAVLNVPVDAGTRYWFQVQDGNFWQAGDTVTFSVVTAPVEEVPVGSLYVPHDIAGWPGSILDQTTGDVLRMLHPFPAGERADILPNGIMCVSDSSDLTVVHVYDASVWPFALIATVPAVSSGLRGVFSPVITQDGSRFYVIDWIFGGGNTTFNVTAISDAGVIEDTWSFVASAGSITLRAAGVSRDGATLYWHGSSASTQAVKQYSLATSTPLADLVATVATGTPTYRLDLPVLADDTILVGYNPSGVDYIRRYDSIGTLLNTYTFASDEVLNRLAVAEDDPDSFWVWHFVGNESRFTRINVSDGATLETFDLVQFNSGIGPDWDTLTPPNASDPVRFQHSNSCPFLVLRNLLEAPVEETEPPDSTVGGGDTPITGSYTRELICLHGEYRRTINLTGSYARVFSVFVGDT